MVLMELSHCVLAKKGKYHIHPKAKSNLFDSGLKVIRSLILIAIQSVDIFFFLSHFGHGNNSHNSDFGRPI